MVAALAAVRSGRQGRRASAALIWNGIGVSALPGLDHRLPLVGGAVETVYSDEPPMYAAVTIGKAMTVVHSDAFLDRCPARMHRDADRGNWF